MICTNGWVIISNQFEPIKSLSVNCLRKLSRQLKLMPLLHEVPQGMAHFKGVEFLMNFKWELKLLGNDYSF